MNLTEIAEQDLSVTLEGDAGLQVKLLEYSDPIIEYELDAQTTDIGFRIDPDLGIELRGRIAECNFRMSSVLAATGGRLPDTRSWGVRFTNANGEEFEFKFQMIDPDRKLGVLRGTLEIVNVG